jgi:hypothetical protein
VKGTFIPKNGNGRNEIYTVTFSLVLSSGAIVQKTATWNFPTYFAASPLTTVTIGNNTIINLTPGAEVRLSNVSIDTVGL